MSFRKSDHFTDRLFRQKLKDVDLGQQDHLWKGIEAALDESKKSRRVLSFPWMIKSVLVLSLISFSLLASYRFFVNSAGFQKTETINKTKISAQTFADQSFSNQQQGGSAESLITKISKEKAELLEKDHLQSTVIKQKNILKGSVNSKSGSEVGFSPSQIFSENVSKDEEGDVGFGSSDYMKSESRSVNDMIKENGSVSQSIELLTKKDQTYIDYLDNNLWPKQKKFIDDGCFTRDKSLERRRIYVDIYYSPEMSRRTIEAKNVQFVAYANKRKMDETFIKAFSVGSRVSMVSSKGLSLRTGINYSEIKERFNFVKGTQLITLIKKDAQGNPIDTVQEEVAIVDNIYNRYKFIDIPLSVGYEIDLVDFVFTVSGGIGINLMTKRAGYIYGPDLSSKLNLSSAVEGNQKIFKDNAGISLLASFGLNYKIGRGFMLLAEPSMRYYLGSLTDSQYPISQKYIQFGLIAGLRYQLVY